MAKSEIIEVVSEKEALEIMREAILSARIPFEKVEKATYHHNTQYSSTPEIINIGLLSYLEKMKLLGKEPNEKELAIRNDYHFVNGTTYISLAKEGFTEADLYPGEDLWIYHYEAPHNIDIVISNEVQARGIAINYLNEYLAEDKVPNTMFKAIDIRLLDFFINNEDISKKLEKYNHLSAIAFALQCENLNIPLRHNGTEQFGLDIEKVSSFPVVRIRR